MHTYGFPNYQSGKLLQNFVEVELDLLRQAIKSQEPCHWWVFANNNINILYWKVCSHLRNRWFIPIPPCSIGHHPLFLFFLFCPLLEWLWWVVLSTMSVNDYYQVSITGSLFPQRLSDIMRTSAHIQVQPMMGLQQWWSKVSLLTTSAWCCLVLGTVTMKTGLQLLDGLRVSLGAGWS